MARWSFDQTSLVLSPVYAPAGASKLLRDGDTLWLLYHDRDPSLLRRSDGKWQLVASGSAAFALPDPYSTLYRHFVSAWFDDGPCYVAVHYDQLFIARFDGKCFVRLKPANAMEGASCDAFVFDERRKVLVHFVVASTRDVGRDQERVKRFGQGVAVRELGRGGWIDREEHCTSLEGDLHAAWDNARKATVVLDRSGNCAAWDGKLWSKLPELPFYLQNRPEMALDEDGRLVLAHVSITSRGGRYEEHIGQLARLGAKSWQDLDTGGVRDFRGGVFDPALGTAVFFAPLFGPGSCSPQFAALRKDRLEPVPPWFPPWEHAVALTPDQALYQGRALSGLDRSTPALEAAAEKEQLALVDARGVTPLPPADAALQDLVATPRGPMTVGWRGEVFLFEDGAIKKIGEAPPDLKPRRDSAIAWVRDSLVIVGGCTLSGYNDIRESWRWSDGAWTPLKAKGKHPVEHGGSAAFDEARGVLVISGGKKQYKANGLTTEWDGKRWTQFPTKVEVRDLQWDGKRVIGFDYSDVFVYQGQGRWKNAGTVEPGENDERLGTPRAFDRQNQKLFGFGSCGVHFCARGEASIADLLAVAPKAGKAPAPPKVKLVAVRHLKFEDGRSKKFWFGQVKGPSLAMRWGKRGAEGQSKSLRCKSSDAALKELAKRAQAKIDEGYLDAPEGEAAARIPGTFTWVMSYHKGRGADRVGGMPPSLKWPICKDCQTPMIFVMLLHKNADWLPLKKHRALAVFTCNGKYSGGSCETWDDDCGCNAVLFLDDKTLKKPLLDKIPAGPKGKPDQLPPRAIRYEKVFEPDTSIEEDEERINDDKVGGYPGFIQGDQTPKCKKCKKPMRFVAQFDEIGELNFGGGRAYVYVCSDEHEARFFWQQ